MNTSDIASIVTAAVAVAGLVLSIYNFDKSRRDRRPELVARVSNGFLTRGPNLSDVMLFLEVANPGEKKTIVSGVQIICGKHAVFFPNGIDGTRSIPFELQTGENANFWTLLKEFVHTLQEQGMSGRVKK